jgi:hypothetical protein
LKTTPDYGVAQTHLSSGDGGQLIASLERLPPGTAPEPRGLPAAVRVSGIEHTGEYTGVLSLDPTNEDAAALDVTVKARHS